MEGQDPYSELVTIKNQSEEFSVSSLEEPKLYTHDFLSFAVKLHRNEKEILFDQATGPCSPNDYLTWNLPQTRASVDFYDAWVPFPNEGTIAESSSISATTIPLRMEDMPAKDGGGTAGNARENMNCGPTALTNIIRLYATSNLNGQSAMGISLYRNGSVENTYRRLSVLCGYDKKNGTLFSRMSPALNTYCTEQGFSCSSNLYLSSFWTDFTRDINANKPILLYASGYSEGAYTGHYAVVTGYVKYSNHSQYLKVFSGWESFPTYVKFKAACLDLFNGQCVSIRRS